MSLTDISPVYRDLLCYAFLLLYFLYAIHMIRSLWYRDWKHAGQYGILFSGAYVLHQMIRTVIKAGTFSMYLGEVPAWMYDLAAGILFIFWLVSIQRFAVWNRDHVSTTSVKESLDNLPSSIVIFREDGSCVMTNHRMNRLGEQMTGHTALDGKELLEAARNCQMTVEQKGRNYVFHHRTLEYKGELLQELIADDVTELYEKTEELSRGNQQLSELAEKMKQYGRTIDESIRKQEILDIKIRIHDEMNQLLLATENAAAGGNGNEEQKKILRTWQNHVLLLSMGAREEVPDHAIEDMETLAAMIGIEIIWNGTLETMDPEIRKLFEQITREAMANAVKHAAAKHLFVTIENGEGNLILTYENDGTSAPDTVIEGGGLSNLRTVISQHHGQMMIRPVPVFTLKITIPLREE